MKGILDIGEFSVDRVDDIYNLEDINYNVVEITITTADDFPNSLETQLIMMKLQL